MAKRQPSFIGHIHRHGKLSAPNRLSTGAALESTTADATVLSPDTTAEEDGNDDDDASSFELGAWVPVSSVSSLKGIIPFPIEMMGRQFVVWNAPPPPPPPSSSSRNRKRGRRHRQQHKRQHDASKERWSVLLDECPHRLAPLSQGRIDFETQCLECPYHGWQFEHTNGTLTRIPHLESGEAPLLAHKRSARSFPTHVTGDVLWTFLPTEMHGESFPRSLLPEHMYEGLQDIVSREGTTFYVHDMPCSFDFFVENTLDAPSHAHFAHHGLSFSREEAEPFPCKVVKSNFTHLSTQLEYTRNGVFRRRRFDFQRPFYATNKMPAAPKTGGGQEEEEEEEKWVTQIVFLKTPIRDGWCRMISNFQLLKPHPMIPDWLNHILNLRFLEGDAIQHLVEYNVRVANSGGASPTTLNYIHATPADTPVRAWRQWWRQYGMATESPPHTFGPAQPRNLQRLQRHQQVDPWRLHTSHCHKCRTVLRRSKLVRKVAMALLWFGTANIFSKKWKSAVLLLLVGGLTHQIATRLIWELEGPPTRDLVGDRSASAAAP